MSNTVTESHTATQKLASNLRPGDTTLFSTQPGNAESTQIVTCIKALRLPNDLVEVAWVDENDKKVSETIYRANSIVTCYELTR